MHSDPLPLPDDLPAQVKRAFQLGNIFMPEARRQRDAIYSKQEVPKFVHYTRAEAALNIISQKRLWMRNTTMMVDYREVHHGFDLLNTFFADLSNKLAFNKAFDEFHPGAAVIAQALFAQWYIFSEGGLQTGTYIASISELDASEDEHGRLSMWRAFGSNDVARVAIVFQVPKYSGAMDFLHCIFSPVAYATEQKVHDVLREVISNLDREAALLSSLSKDELINWIFFMFVAGVTCLKHQGFREERMESSLLSWPFGLTPH